MLNYQRVDHVRSFSYWIHGFWCVFHIFFDVSSLFALSPGPTQATRATQATQATGPHRFLQEDQPIAQDLRAVLRTLHRHLRSGPDWWGPGIPGPGKHIKNDGTWPIYRWFNLLEMVMFDSYYGKIHHFLMALRLDLLKMVIFYS